MNDSIEVLRVAKATKCGIFMPRFFAIFLKVYRVFALFHRDFLWSLYSDYRC
jgi:hypothetical protein